MDILGKEKLGYEFGTKNHYTGAPEKLCPKCDKPMKRYIDFKGLIVWKIWECECGKKIKKRL